MAFRSFDISDSVSFRRAAASAIPNIMAIAGPNGAGKSRLLFQLWQQAQELAEPGTDVAYLGPHRGWRRTQLGTYSLGEFQPSFSSYLREMTLPGFRQFNPPGMQRVQTGEVRDPTGMDDSLAFVKSSILKIDFSSTRTSARCLARRRK